MKEESRSKYRYSMYNDRMALTFPHESRKRKKKKKGGASQKEFHTHTCSQTNEHKKYRWSQNRKNRWSNLRGDLMSRLVAMTAVRRWGLLLGAWAMKWRRVALAAHLTSTPFSAAARLVPCTKTAKTKISRFNKVAAIVNRLLHIPITRFNIVVPLA